MLVNEKHYLSDKESTEWNIGLRMKIGSSHSSKGIEDGIHWHINKNIKVEYIPSSPKRESIPWVKYTNLKTGDTVIYQDSDNALSQEDISAATPREMDCMDCHNRPTHNFRAPQRFVDNAIASGDIPHELPRIKDISMQVLNKSYSTTDTALMSIEEKIGNFYKDKYPEIYNNKKELVDMAITSIKDEYQLNIFPEMQANWDNYPDHIGHIIYNGCFRCHNDRHKSDDGRVISKDCNLCHTILSQGNADSMQVTSLNSSLEFRHPIDIDGEWKNNLCTECHRYLY